MTQPNVTIGDTDLVTTPLGLGTNAVGGNNLFPNLVDQTGIDIVKAGLNSGITLLDTAYAYGLGHSEELIGKAIKDYNRHSFAIATKGAQDFSSGQQIINNDPQFLVQQVDNSLRRLQTDYLDIFYIHFPDEQTPKAEAVGALQRLKEQGKIRAIGISNFSLSQIVEANADGYVDVVEDEYSLLHQQNAKEMMPYLAENMISFVPYFPLASGLLTGKYNSAVSFVDNDIRSQMDDFKGQRFSEALTAVSQVQPIAASHGATIAQVILAWYMQNPLVSVVIPGAKRPEQVESNAQSMSIELTPDEYQRIDQAFKYFK